MDTTTPAGRAFLQIQAALADMERNVSLEADMVAPPAVPTA